MKSGLKLLPSRLQLLGKSSPRSMELRNLSRDCFLAIVNLLDSFDVAKLYGSLDLTIQRSLSTSGALRFVTASWKVEGLFLYFLRSIRKVHELDLSQADDQVWVTLVQTLSPEILHVLSIEVFHRDPKAPSAENDVATMQHMAKMAQFWMPQLLANAPSLTAIYTNNLISSLPRRDLREDLVLYTALPPGITTFHFPYTNLALSQVLDVLPASVTDLSIEAPLKTQLPLEGLLKRYPSLTRFAVNRSQLQISSDYFELPSSLTDLKIGYTSTIPYEFLQSKVLTSSKSLVKLELMTLLQWPNDFVGRSIEERRLDLASILPSSLQTLMFTFPGRGAFNKAYVVLHNFPTSLTKLCIAIHSLEDSVGFPDLSYLPNLKHLDVKLPFFRQGGLRFANSKTPPLHPSDPPKPTLSLHKLPRSIEVLKLQGSLFPTLSEDDYADLPRSLQSLYVSTIDLNSVSNFHQLRPSTYILVSEPFAFQDVREQHRVLFKAILSGFPFLTDINVLIEVALRYFARRRVFLEFDHPEFENDDCTM